jgi:membrane protease subunit HflC
VISERVGIMTMLKEKANESAKSLGASVIDVRIKRIDLPKEVSASVFERMRTEREQVATKHRSDGKAAGEVVRADADAKVTVIFAKAKTNSARIRAEGNAKAARIYANAYNKDAKFYAFYRSLEAYMNAFHNKHDLLLLKPDSQFFRYLHAVK